VENVDRVGQETRQRGGGLEKEKEREWCGSAHNLFSEIIANFLEK
jgi:hypothetical protein